MVPLYDVHISLMNAENSSVELVYKPNKANIEVGLHLGMVASGGIDLRSLLAEKALPRLTTQEPLTIGEAFADTAITTTCDEKQGKLLAMVTLASSGNDEHTTLNVSNSLEAGQTYTIEPLQDGWYRLTLHLSSLMCVDELRRSQGPSYNAMSTIVLSQLGITLTYENDDASTLGAEADFSTQSLVTFGSLAVVPTWSLRFHGSCVTAVTSKASRVDKISQPEAASLVRQKAQEETSVDTMEEGGNEWLKVSTTLKWSVSHVVLPTDSSSSVSSSVATPSTEAQPQIPTTDCSHYCVYLSAVDDPYQAQFVGTAFTTQYRISNFGLQAPKEETTPTPTLSPPSSPSPQSPKVAPARKIKAFIQGVFKDREDAQSGGSVESPTRKIWAFVQGVCRDGRADSANMWVKCLI